MNANLDLFDSLVPPPRKPLGTEPRKLVRRKDPDTSHEAAHKVDSESLEGLVLAAIRSFGAAGCISDEVRALFPGKAYSSVTARFKALKEKGYVNDTLLRRPGNTGRNQAVLVASEFV